MTANDRFDAGQDGHAAWLGMGVAVLTVSIALAAFLLL